MFQTILDNILTLILGLISAGTLAYARIIHNKFEHFHDLEKDEDDEKLIAKIQKQLEPLNEKIDEDYRRFNSIKDFLRYVIIEYCERLLEKEYMTTEEYSKLSEIYKVYAGIGGNSQAAEYFHKTVKLPVYGKDETKQ